MTTPTPEEARRAAGRLGQIAEIEALVLRRLHWTTNEVQFDPTLPIKAEPTFNVAQGKTGTLLRYQINASITGRVAAGELLRMESSHEAFFRIPDNDPTTEAELAAFGSVTVFFMVFPYIREELHRLTGNAGLPAILLAPLRVPFDPATGRPSQQLVDALQPAVTATAESSGS